jgi:hypothetical protein
MMSRRKFNFTFHLFITGTICLMALIGLPVFPGLAQGGPGAGVVMADHGQQRMPLFLGTKTPYQAPGGSYTPPPAGYSPVFVNYVGRHGARFMTKAGADLRVLEVLQAAEKSNSLTAKGKEVKAMTERLLALEKDKYEQITLLGKEEQEAIGERMLYNYGGVFRGNGLEIVTTYKLRTQQSAEGFLRGLARVPGKREYTKAVDSLDAVLRFYDLSPAYQRYKKNAVLRQSLDSLDRDKRTRMAAVHIRGSLFTPGFEFPSSGGTMGGDAVAFADDLYDLYSVQFSLPGEMQEKGYPKDSVDLGIAFERKDLEWLDYRSGAQDFLEKGPGRDPLGIQIRVAAPMLVDFINSTDKVVGDVGAAPDAILRFTHAEAISPFATLLGIPQASTAAASIYNVRWRAESVIPLSANIQWILYSNGKDWLVKVLLNERESALPVGTKQYPYYRWEDVKRYYIKRLRTIHAGLQDDMHIYLKKLD